MQSFEDVRAFASTQFKLKDNESYLLSFDLSLHAGKRLQSMFLADLETEDGSKVLRVSTPVVRFGHINAERCLRFNWAQRVGYLALSEMDDAEYLQLCENRPYEGLNEKELLRVIAEMGSLADLLEQGLSKDRDES
jgi:hypothetical protein